MIEDFLLRHSRQPNEFGCHYWEEIEGYDGCRPGDLLLAGKWEQEKFYLTYLTVHLNELSELSLHKVSIT